tara:strand:- start:1414 stop:2184 length:771 start_codon:yes stop_codon:yes gene_type:complete
MTRIVWSVIEKGAVFTNMESVFAMHPNATRKDALRMAQTVLKSHRWIKVTNQRVFNHKDRIDIARQKALQASKKKPPEAVEAPAPILAPTPAPERKETPKGRLADILELLLDVVADSVAAKVSANIRPPMAREELRQYVDQQFEAEFAKYPRPRHDPRPIPHATGKAKPGVLVIGLLASQAYAVISTWGTRLDLTFMTPEDAVHRPKLVRAHTVLMTKFINHSVQDKYRKAPKLHFVNGGMGELGEVLDSIVPPVL